MNRVPVAPEGGATTAPGRGGNSSGRVGAGTAGGREADGETRSAGSREGAPAQPERRRSATKTALQSRVCGLRACISYPAGGVVPPGGAGVTIFASCMNGVSRSIGTGKMVVELFSAATSRSVWR